MTTFIVIFGAAVKADGEPSGTMLRRVFSAIEVAKHTDDVIFLPTGGQGKYGEPEARVMANLLAREGFPDALVLRDEESSDTLDSIVNCSTILQRHANAADRVIVCSSRYHNPRCVLLFRMLGVPAQLVKVLPDSGELSTEKLIFFYCKELPAIIWDCWLLSWRLITGKVEKADFKKESARRS